MPSLMLPYVTCRVFLSRILHKAPTVRLPDHEQAILVGLAEIRHGIASRHMVAYSPIAPYVKLQLPLAPLYYIRWYQ